MRCTGFSCWRKVSSALADQSRPVVSIQMRRRNSGRPDAARKESISPLAMLPWLSRNLHWIAA